MKFLIGLLFASTAYAQKIEYWKKIELPSEGNGMVIEIPVHADGTMDPSRLQRRADDPSARKKRLTPNTNPLWPIRKMWSAADESDYSMWVKRNAKEDFFVGTGVAVDCADAAIALRWVYARLNGLPAAQTLAGSGRLFGNWGSTNEWDALSSDPDWRKDVRFKSALKYLLNHIYTHSILNDLYPVEITPAHLVPGTVNLMLAGTSGHTRTLLTVAPGVTEFIYGNMPPAEEMYQHEDMVFYVPPEGGGFLHFRWPEEVNGQWQLRDGKQMAGYSTEQYDWGEYDFATNFNDRLNLWNTLHDQITGSAVQFVKKIYERVDVVAWGYYMCAVVPCAPGSLEDIDYSTPQRDFRLSQQAATLENLFARLTPGDWLMQDLQAKYNKPVFAGIALNVWDLFSEAAIQKFNSAPQVSVSERWGIRETQDLAGFMLRALVLRRNWEMRLQKVMTALMYCYPNGENAPPACDPNAPEIKALDTSRVDQAFRLEKAALTALFAQLPAADQAAARAALEGEPTWTHRCNGSPEGICSVWDLLTNGLIDTMTSNPVDPYSSREGTP